MHALCVKRVSCIFKKLAADEDRAEEKRTRQKYVNADAALEIYRPIPLPLVEWKSIPDTSTINGRENNKLGSRSPRMFMRYGPPPNRSAGNVTIAATTTFERGFCFSKKILLIFGASWTTNDYIFRLFPMFVRRDAYIRCNVHKMCHLHFCIFHVYFTSTNFGFSCKKKCEKKLEILSSKCTQLLIEVTFCFILSRIRGIKGIDPSI